MRSLACLLALVSFSAALPVNKIDNVELQKKELELRELQEIDSILSGGTGKRECRNY